MADYTEQQLIGALRKADAAGDTEAARAIARRIQSMRQQPADFSGVTARTESTEQRVSPEANRSDFAGLVTGKRKPNAFYTAAGGMGMTDAAGMLDAAQHHLLNIPVGIGQGITHGLDWLTQVAAPRSKAAKRSADYTADLDRQVRQREANYQARNPDTAGSYAGAAVGEVLPWMVGIGAARSAGLLPTLPRVSQVQGAGAKIANIAAKGGLLAAEGGAMGAVTPVTEEGGYGAQKAAQVGVGAVAAPAIAGTLGGLGRVASLRDYLTTAGRERIAGSRLAQLYGTDPATLATLRQASPVPGFVPTPAQALQTPEAIQAERVLRNSGATAPFFAGREAANNAALRGVVADLAGEPGDIAAAKAARAAATQPYYDSLVGRQIPVSNVMAELDALANSSLGVRPKIKMAINSLRTEINNRAAGGPTIDASVLSGIRENVHSFLGDMPSAQEKKALGPIANFIADEIDAYIPGYRANLDAYAKASQPITNMQSARQFLDAIDRGGRDAYGGQTVDLAKIRQALARDDRAKFKMSPQARKMLEQVLDAAQQRSVTNNTIAATGPGTAADVLRGAGVSPMWQRIAGQAGGGVGALFGGLPGYAAGLGMVEAGNAANNAVLRQVGQRGASAPATAQAIEAYLQRQRPPAALPYSPLSALLPYGTQP